MLASTRLSVVQKAANPQPVLLTIAGFDPSSGAGITADLKIFAAHKLYGVAAITALTVQSTQGVRRVDPVSPDHLRQTLECLAEDLPIAGVKIGMLATSPLVEVVADFLEKSGISAARVVLDPIVQSSSGRSLLSQDGVERLRERLLPRVGWATPNVEELAALTELADEPVPVRQAIEEAAARLGAKCPGLNLVVTGGHLDPPDDFLRAADGTTCWLPGERIDTRATHGTGCTFSSALLARLVKGERGPLAVSGAKAYVAAALQAAQPLGHGCGPLHHLYGWDAAESAGG